jgi:hypothetical protein
MLRVSGLVHRALGLALGLVGGLAVTSLMPGARAQSLSSLVITSPGSGATVSGTVVLTAIAGSPDVEGIQFRVSGVNLGPEITGGSCTAAWNTAAGPDGAYALTVVGRDSSGNFSTSAPVNVTVANTAAPPPPPPPPSPTPTPTPPPLPPPPGDPNGPQITAVATANVTTSQASIVWTTNQASNSEVEYGTSTNFGSTRSNASLVSEHLITLTELTPGTTYHFRVWSRNAQNVAGASASFAFTTAVNVPAPEPGPTPAPEEPTTRTIGRRDTRDQGKGGRSENGGPTVSQAKIAASGSKNATGSPIVAPLPAAPVSKSSAPRAAACSAPDPFANIPGLVGVCIRGSWVPMKRE